LSCRQISLFLAKQNSSPAQKSPPSHDNALLPLPLHAGSSTVGPRLPLLGHPPFYPAATKPTFSFAPVFTATLHLGKPFSPISIFGGELINEAITSGSVIGPAINATIHVGFAHPPIYNNGTLQVPIIDAYGTTEDGESFYIHEEGIGTNGAQVTRIVSIPETRTIWDFS
jgi:hypothetical protein